MYEQIKKLADEALAIQNKDRMDAALREISTLCDQPAAEQPKQRGKKSAEQQADAGGAEGGAQ
jgi:DNA-binding SARP family transcriptional activator